MKSVCKSLMLSIALGITTLMPSGLLGQSLPEPAIVVSISNLDKQMNDVKYLLTASGFPEFNFIASTAIKGYTKGIDTAGNAGVLMFFDDDAQIPDFLGFVKVTDFEVMLDVASGMAEIEENGDDIAIVTGDGTKIYLKENSGYAFFTTNKELLEELPADPTKMLGDMPSKFNLAARIIPSRVPEGLKEQALAAIREGSEQTFDQLDKDDLQYELQKKNLEMQMQQFEMLLTQTDQMVFGWGVNQETNTLFMDVVVTGLEGSELAKKMADSKPTSPSRFTGFLMDGAAFTMNSNARMSDEDSQIYGQMLDDIQGSVVDSMNEDGDFSDDEFAVIKKAVSNVFDEVKQTMKEGVFDGGAVVMLEGEKMNFAAGMQVADAKNIENTIKDLVPMINDKADGKADIKLNSGSYKNVTFHEINVPVDENEEEMRKMFGEKLQIVVGIGKKEVYLGAGTNPVDVIKKAMDDTRQVNNLQQFNVFVTPILKTASRMGGPPEIEMMASKLAEVGKDRMSMIFNLIPNGVETHFEMQDGILSLIKVGVESFQAGGIPQNDF